MSRFRLARVLFAFVLLTTPVFAQRYAWKEGTYLPEMRLPTIDGTQTISLSDFRGTKLLLVEFASW